MYKQKVTSKIGKIGFADKNLRRLVITPTAAKSRFVMARNEAIKKTQKELNQTRQKIRFPLLGTTVVQKLNQGCATRGDNYASLPFLVTLCASKK